MMNIAASAQPPRPGARNDLTDIRGLKVGHAADVGAQTGVTVVLVDGFATAAADVRGGGPATRETDALAPDGLVGGVHAVTFSGGSVFGLAAADGVAETLSAAGVGLQVSPTAPAVPIVPSACIFDFPRRPPDAARGAVDYRGLGAAAAAAATSAGVALGSVGVGLGAMAGTVKGGVGSASLDLGDGVLVAALVAANPVGSVYMPDGRCFWAWPFEIDGEFGGETPSSDAPRAVEPAPADTKLARRRAPIRFNTTVGLVATSAGLDQAETKRLAMMAQDGVARAVRPAHTPFDGDALFALATGAAVDGDAGASREDRMARLARLGAAAGDCVARAIARAVFAARAG